MGGTFEEIVGRHPPKKNGSEGSAITVSERMAGMISGGEV